MRDHCHFTGKHRAAAHVICNLNTRQTLFNYLPMAFHNLKIYDALLFFTALIKQKNSRRKFDFNAKPDEKYASKIYGCIRVIDLFSFMNESSDALVKDLEGEEIELTRKAIGGQWETVKQKMVDL